MPIIALLASICVFIVGGFLVTGGIMFGPETQLGPYGKVFLVSCGFTVIGGIVAAFSYIITLEKRSEKQRGRYR